MWCIAIVGLTVRGRNTKVREAIRMVTIWKNHCTFVGVLISGAVETFANSTSLFEKQTIFRKFNVKCMYILKVCFFAFDF